jgi:hypothetical protein
MPTFKGVNTGQVVARQRKELWVEGLRGEWKFSSVLFTIAKQAAQTGYIER